MESVNAIKSYYEYLTQTANLSITIHYLPRQSKKVYFINALPIPQIHLNPYCTLIKQTLGLHRRCLKCQEKSIGKCSKTGSFSGTCHAGVFEYVYPLKFGEELVGMLSVGGYRSDNLNDCINIIQKECHVSPETISEYSSVLKTDIPEKELVDTLIIPLLCMIKNVSVVQHGNRNLVNSLFPIKRIVNYCNLFYTKKLTVEFLSQRFFCSTSYIARNFKKETGKSLPEYINSLRIKHAMELLKSTNADVAQIGISVGYEDPSYFTKCFVKIVGVTPKKWRQNNKSQELS